jgi:DNA/RNA endonuclease YhcR with UshA esterase domain
MKIKKIFLAVLALLLVAAPSATNASQTKQTVIFSEIAWAGSSLSNSDEWLELSNVSNEQVDISGWNLTGASKDPLSIPNDTVLEPYSTYLISNYDKAHENTTLERPSNLSTPSLSLSNSKFSLVLKDNNDSQVDSAGNGKAPFVGGVDKSGESNDGRFTSMVRRAGELNGTLNSSWEAATASTGFKSTSTELGTPGTLEPHFQKVETKTETENKETADTTFTAPTKVSLKINEFVSSPEKDEPEWIELVNRSTESVSTAGWTIEDSTGKQTPVPEVNLGPVEYLVIENPLAKLNNSGDSVILRNPNGDVVDAVDYGTEKIPAPKTGASMIANVYSGFVETYKPTPGDHNKQTKKEDIKKVESDTAPKTDETTLAPAPKKSPTAATVKTAEKVNSSADVKLVELYPNTLGQDEKEEYVKLHNFGKSTISLNGWSIQDASGKTFTLNDVSIQPNKDLSINRTVSKITLNNSGDVVTLIDSNDSLVDSQSYEKAKKGAKLILTNNEWVWTGDSKKNEPSTLQNDSSTKTSGTPKSTKASNGTTSTYSSVLVKEAKQMKDESKVTLSGYAIVGDNVMSSRTFYLSDETGGVQIYKHDASLPEIKEGQKVEVSGILSTSRNERRVKLTGDQSVTLSDEYSIIEKINLTSSENLEKNVGNLVSVSGIVLSRTNRLVLLEDSSNDWTVELEEGSNIDPTIFQSGSTVDVTGVLTQYDNSFKIKPRSMNDVSVKEVETEQNAIAGTTGIDKSNDDNTIYGYALLTSALLLISGFYLWQRKKTNLYGTQPSYSV